MAVVERLAPLCYQQGEWAHTVFRLFDWLATVLRKRTTLDGISAQALRQATAEREAGAAFVLGRSDATPD